MTEPLSFVNMIYLMWSEPDEGGYNYQLYPLRERWGATPKVRVPTNIAYRIREKADKSYPILVVDGYSIDGLLDKFATGERDLGISAAKFGMFPRRVVGSGNDNWGDSVSEFMKVWESGKEF